MNRFNTALALVLLVSGTLFAQSAAAQYPYTPNSQAFSPWMGLWQKNTGALDNYHTYVQPQMNLNQTLQTQNVALARQAAGLQVLNNAIMQPQENQSGMLPTGQGATFMNYSHYYYRQSSRPMTLQAAASPGFRRAVAAGMAH
jgi:hypothetical protein